MKTAEGLDTFGRVSNSYTKSSAAADVDVNVSRLTDRLLHIVQSYGVQTDAADSLSKTIATFSPIVTKQVAEARPIQLVLPAFPCKSPNRTDKVLGALPDLGEELALAHLNGLCQSIQEVYQYGAKVVITSDGLVYNDLIGVSDEDVWNYGEALRQLALKKNLEHIQFLRLGDLLGHPGPKSTSADAAKSFYLAHADCIRRELVYRYEDRSFNPDVAIGRDEDICLTYRGYLQFLAEDLKNSPGFRDLSKSKREISIRQIAKSMLIRGRAFAAAVKANMPDCVRLSIHDSTSGSKLSLSLIPQSQNLLGSTPWHSCVAVGVEGSYKTVRAADVLDTHDLIYQNGRPHHFRERSELFDWSPLIVKFEHLYPCGVIVRPADIDDSRAPPSLRDLPMQKLRALSNTMSPVVLRGFAETTQKELFIEKAGDLGELLPWHFGLIHIVKDIGKSGKSDNNQTSNEAMPMHYDGVFKFKDVPDPEIGVVKKVHEPVGYQFFTCINVGDGPREDQGQTLFASSRLFFKYLQKPWDLERLEPVKWSIEATGFWGKKIPKAEHLPLVVRHPVNNTPCMRWHEHWDETKTKYSTFSETIENEDEVLGEVVTELLYDRRVCLRFEWEKGDMVVSDNLAMLHTRTKFGEGCARELWRIHFN